MVKERLLRSIGWRWFATALLILMAALLAACVIPQSVSRDSGQRFFTVTYCGALPICVPFQIDWRTSFVGNGNQYYIEDTWYNYQLEYWEQQLTIYDMFTFPLIPNYPFGINYAWSNHVYSYQFGDLGLVPVSPSCPSYAYDVADYFVCRSWSGIFDLGLPGGYGEYQAGVQAVGVFPIPIPNDGVVYPWFMFHVK